MRLGIGLGLGTRRGGAAAYLPPTLGNLTLALDARSVVLNGSDVQRMTDLSASGLVVQQLTGALQPAYLADSGDSAPSVSFGGAADPQYLVGTSSTMPVDADGNFTMVALAKLTNAGGYIVNMSRSDVQSDWCAINSGAGFAIAKLYNGSVDNEFQVAASFAWHYVVFRRSGGTLKLRVDGGADSTLAATATNVDPNSLVIGALNFGGSFINPLAGEVRFVAMYAEDIGDTNVASLRTWLQSQFPSVP